MADTPQAAQSEKISKKEAVYLALAELGGGAMPIAIQTWVKDKFGIEMTAGHVSTLKGEYLKAAKNAGAAPTAAAKPATTAAAPAAKGEKLTKNEAVRRAVLAIGKEATRVQVQRYVKEHFDIDMGLDHASTAKADALRKLGWAAAPSKKKAAHKPADKLAAKVHPAPVPAAAQKPAASSNRKGGVLMADIVTLQGLVERIGLEHVKTLIGVMER